MCLRLGDFALELQQSWDFKTFYTLTPIYSLVSNEASYLRYIAPIFVFLFIL
jgi:hypothetical protein